MCLECEAAFNLSALDAAWRLRRDQGYGRLQFWGQMSGGNEQNELSVEGKERERERGNNCCLMEYAMHPRYIKGPSV